MSTDLAPIPGHTITFTMPPHLSTFKVNRLVQRTTDEVIGRQVKVAAPHSMLHMARANYDQRRAHLYMHGSVPSHYVHGFGTSQRDTLTARYTPSTREMVIHFPPNYTPARAEHDDWLTTRVYIWDALLFAIGGPNGVGGVTKSIT